MQLFHASFEYDANCQEIISLYFECIKFPYSSGSHYLLKQVVKFTRSTSHMQTCFKLRRSTQHYLHQSHFHYTRPQTPTDKTILHQNLITTNYPHGSARYVLLRKFCYNYAIWWKPWEGVVCFLVETRGYIITFKSVKLLFPYSVDLP